MYLPPFTSINPALLIIDVQQAIDHFDTGLRNNPDAELRIAKLLDKWRRHNKPTVHIRHSSKNSDSPYHADSPFFGFKTEVTPMAGEKVVTKSENCAFIDPELDAYLKREQITELVICGVLTNNSVDATVRVAAGLGYRVYLPQDATAAFPLQTLNGKQFSAEDVHWIFLSNLDGEYAKVVETASILSTLPG
ncbi:cysteine hydrolase family protein [Microbulbifer agarilyticus]|uniref:cysteine hydrolase family protein n=1 Tax=Microbulbifer agarilyticus TaxID=260552 RepID=UPI001CD22343|nr:cysteine hydrolase family protein [Microbulbifer agarilyticus]MCA0893515.1 cysteine hydrolase [Microbulbifer agarilyticus]